MTAACCMATVPLIPKDSDYFDKNKASYFAKLDELKEEAKKLQEIPSKQRVLVTAHDAFGYFGRMHELEVVGLQGLSTEGEIGVSDIQSTIDIIMEYQVPAVFIESSINESSIQAVIKGAKIGASIGGIIGSGIGILLGIGIGLVTGRIIYKVEFNRQLEFIEGLRNENSLENQTMRRKYYCNPKLKVC